MRKRSPTKKITVVISHPTAYYESNEGPKLNGQEFSLDSEPYCLTAKGSGFTALKVNYKGFFPDKSFSLSFFLYSFLPPSFPLFLPSFLSLSSFG
jgi:hypothetical protein